MDERLEVKKVIGCVHDVVTSSLRIECGFKRSLRKSVSNWSVCASLKLDALQEIMLAVMKIRDMLENL